MNRSEISYYSEIKKMRIIIEKLSNPTSITSLEFNKYKKLYGNMLKGVKVNGFPSPNSFKYPINADVLASRQAVRKLSTPSTSIGEYKSQAVLPVSNDRPPTIPKI